MNRRHRRLNLRQNLRIKPASLLETYATDGIFPRGIHAHAHMTQARMCAHGNHAVGSVGDVGLFIIQQVKKKNAVGNGVGSNKLASVFEN